MELKDLCDALNAAGYTATEAVVDGKKLIELSFYHERMTIELLCELGNNFPVNFPTIHLKNRFSYGHLAHVGWDYQSFWASICIGSDDALSANYHAPVNFFIDYLERAIGFVKKALSDKEYNESEIMKEFTANWRFMQKEKDTPIVSILQPLPKINDIEVRACVNNKKLGLGSHIIVLDTHESICGENSSISIEANRKERRIEGKGCQIEIKNLILPPLPNEDIKEWWYKQLSTLPQSLQDEMEEKSRNTRSRLYYIICHAVIFGKRIWFGIKCKNESKQRVPLHPKYSSEWMFSACNISSFTKENLLPRAGSMLSLQEKKVLVVGCGSVGGHIVQMLAQTGIGNISLVDFDTLSIENIYRHYLPSDCVGYPKTIALKRELEYRFPFLTVEELGLDNSRLLDLTAEDNVHDFDLVIVATGNVTDERIFNEYTKEQKISTPIIYTWLEGFGVGGHSVLAFPEKKGCLNCCFIDKSTGDQLLYPWINLIQPNQDVMKNHGGCGSLFIPYSNIDAVQSATLTSKMAVKVLSNDLTESCSISWRGDSNYAESEGIKLTHRFYRFKNFWEYVPLENPDCRLCNE